MRFRDLHLHAVCRPAGLGPGQSAGSRGGAGRTANFRPTVFDPRIYRAGFIPVIAAVVVLMFSLERAPDPLELPIGTPPFSAQESSQLARALAREAPVRTPGSEGDLASADLVRESFAEIDGGEVAEQSFEAPFDGATVDTRNVILTLPGQRPETLLIVAPRDTAGSSPGAATSAASTATLLTLADILGSSRHERTIVLASVSASGSGSRGIRELVAALPLEGGVEAAIAIEAPGVRERQRPFVIPGRSPNHSPPAVLVGTAEAIATLQFGEEAAPTNGWRSFVRLALPLGIGPGDALADEGLEAITISAAGERPPETDEGTVWRRTMSMAGSSVLGLVLTIDESEATVSGGPDSYLAIGDNLLPTWTLGLLGLTLILPALLAAGDLWLHDRRRDPRKARRAVPWVLERGLPPLAALLLAYLLALVGLIPDPAVPYDPGEFPPGVEGAVALLLLLGVAIAALMIRPMRTPLDAEPQTLAAAAGVIGSVALLGIWLLEPLMALLLAPTAHVWVLAARPQGPPRALLVGAVALLSLLPIAAASVELASSLALGASILWQPLLMVVTGQIGTLTALLWCPLLGGLAACLAACRAGPQTAPPTPTTRTRVRGPSGYAGPGSLGGTASTWRR